MKQNEQLLNANTVSFSGLISADNVYQVPLFQRDYSWSEEHWDDAASKDILPASSTLAFLSKVLLRLCFVLVFRCDSSTDEEKEKDYEGRWSACSPDCEPYDERSD